MTHPGHRRRGMSLLEIMVVIAIMAVVLGIGLPSLSSIFDLEQRGAARELAMTYKFLLSEATMRNVTFRIAYNLDENSYRIEVGDPNTLVFSDPEAREAFEEEERRSLKRLTKSEKEDAAESAADPKFAGLESPGFQSSVQLPPHSVFSFVYTPQYGEPQVPSTEPPRRDDPPNIVYSYVFADGEAEYTVVRIVNDEDPEEGYTIEVEPLSGNVRVDSELTDIGASLEWLPDEAPESR